MACCMERDQIAQHFDKAIGRVQPDPISGLQQLGCIFHVSQCREAVLPRHGGGMGKSTSHLHDHSCGEGEKRAPGRVRRGGNQYRARLHPVDCGRFVKHHHFAFHTASTDTKTPQLGFIHSH